MKMLIGLISPGKLSELSKHMEGHGSCGMTLSEVKFPVEDDRRAMNGARGNRISDYKSMIRFEIAIQDEKADGLVQSLLGNNIVDSNTDCVYICDLSYGVRVKTGDKM